MTHPTLARPRILPAGPPTVDDVREGLRATLPAGDFERIWPEVTTRAGLAPDVASLDDADLDLLLTRISTQDRLCQVLAMSWRIRCTAARKLAELGR